MDILRAFILDGTTYNVNIIWDNDRPLFRAADIAKVLDIKKVRNSLASFPERMKVIHSTSTRGGPQETIFLTEPGVYRLISKSRKPIAEPFTEWVCSEVLPSIRETGKYELQLEVDKRVEEALRGEAEKIRFMCDMVRHEALIDAFKGPEKYITYIGRIRFCPDGYTLIKVGSTKEIKTRATDIATDYGAFVLLHVFECPMNEPFERFLQRHEAIRPLAFRDVVHNGRRSNGEIFRMTSQDLDKLVAIAKRNLHKFVDGARAQQILDIERAKADTAKYEYLISKPAVDKQDVGVQATAPASPPVVIVQQDTRRYTQGRGQKIQQYSPDGHTLLRTYEGYTQAMRDPNLPDMCLLRIKNATRTRSLYKDFRWAELDRSLPDDTVQAIGESVESATIKKGFVAMLNLDRNQILQVFCDQKAAAHDRKFRGCAAISAAIKRDSQSGGHYFRMWHDCDQALKDDFLARGNTLPNKRVKANGMPVQQLHPTTGTVIREFSCITDVIKVMRVSRKSIQFAIDAGHMVKGGMWRYAGAEAK